MINRLVLSLLLGVLPVAYSLPGYAADPEPVVTTVNINNADAATMARHLEGIGTSRAQEIVRYRDAYGPFYSVDDLMEVRGVGKSIVDNNRQRITLE